MSPVFEERSAKKLVKLLPQYVEILKQELKVALQKKQTFSLTRFLKMWGFGGGAYNNGPDILETYWSMAQYICWTCSWRSENIIISRNLPLSFQRKPELWILVPGSLMMSLIIRADFMELWTFTVLCCKDVVHKINTCF